MPELMEFDLRFSSYRKWILKKPYAYKVNNRIIEVPENFITDLASTPKILWNIFEPMGKNYIRSAVIHVYILKIVNILILVGKKQIKYF